MTEKNKLPTQVVMATDAQKAFAPSVRRSNIDTSDLDRFTWYVEVSYWSESEGKEVFATWRVAPCRRDAEISQVLGKIAEYGEQIKLEKVTVYGWRRPLDEFVQGVIDTAEKKWKGNDNG